MEGVLGFTRLSKASMAQNRLTSTGLERYQTETGTKYSQYDAGGLIPRRQCSVIDIINKTKYSCLLEGHCRSERCIFCWTSVSYSAATNAMFQCTGWRVNCHQLMLNSAYSCLDHYRDQLLTRLLSKTAESRIFLEILTCQGFRYKSAKYDWLCLSL